MLATASVRDDYYIQLWVSNQSMIASFTSVLLTKYLLHIPAKPKHSHYRAALLVLFLSWSIGVFLAVRQAVSADCSDYSV
jgi:hypothetical protein